MAVDSSLSAPQCPEGTNVVCILLQHSGRFFRLWRLSRNAFFFLFKLLAKDCNSFFPFPFPGLTTNTRNQTIRGCLHERRITQAKLSLILGTFSFAYFSENGKPLSVTWHGLGRVQVLTAGYHSCRSDLPQRFFTLKFWRNSRLKV